jgi:hypothetical protein
MSATLTTTRLYNVASVIDGWPHRGSLYDGVHVACDACRMDPGKAPASAVS